MGPLSDVCDAIVAVISADETVTDWVRTLLAEAAPPPAGAHAPSRRERPVEGTMEMFAAGLRPLLQAALADALEDTEEHFAAIRRFYLGPQAEYSLKELASLWRIGTDLVYDVFHDQLSDSPAPHMVTRREAAETAVTYGLLRPYDVERALGADFLRVRGAEWETVPIVLHLPRFVASVFAPETFEASDSAEAARIEQFLFEFCAREYVRGRRTPGAPP